MSVANAPSRTPDISHAQRAQATRHLDKLLNTTQTPWSLESAALNYATKLSSDQRELIKYCFGYMLTPQQLVAMLDAMTRWMTAIITGVYSKADCYSHLISCPDNLAEELRIVAVRGVVDGVKAWLGPVNCMRETLFGNLGFSGKPEYWGTFFPDTKCFTATQLIMCAAEVSRSLVAENTLRQEQAATNSHHVSQMSARHTVASRKQTDSIKSSIMTACSNEALLYMTSHAVAWNSVTLSLGTTAATLPPKITCCISEVTLTDPRHIVVHAIENKAGDGSREIFATLSKRLVPLSSTIFHVPTANTNAQTDEQSDAAVLGSMFDAFENENDDDADVVDLNSNDEFDEKKMAAKNARELDEMDSDDRDFIASDDDSFDEEELSAAIIAATVPPKKHKRLAKHLPGDDDDDDELSAGSTTEDKPKSKSKKSKKTSNKQQRAQSKKRGRDIDVATDAPAPKRPTGPTELFYRLTDSHVTPNGTLIHAIAFHVVSTADLPPSDLLLGKWRMLTLANVEEFVNSACQTTNATWNELAAFMIAMLFDDPSNANVNALVLPLSSVGIYGAVVQMQIMIEWLKKRLEGLSEAEYDQFTNELYNPWARNKELATPRSVQPVAKAIQQAPLISLFVRLLFGGFTI